MDKTDTYKLVQSCIIGTAYENCGVGFDPEQSLEIYHLSEFKENVSPGDITGPFRNPDQFLEEVCRSCTGRIYETMYLMETSWDLGVSALPKEWQRNIARSLWELCQEQACHYLDEMEGVEATSEFLETGDALFVGDSV